MAQEDIQGAPVGFPDSVIVHVRREGATAFVRVVGALDVAAAAPLEKLMTELSTRAGVNCLIADLRRTTSLDSPGLRALLTIEIQARGNGFDFMLIPPHGKAMQALRAAGVDKLIKFQDSDGAQAAERASAGLGTHDDFGYWLTSQR
jgi:anti-anti-sigma factor